jgi:hypothetical protein
MEPEEVRYRALLGVVYRDLTRDLNPLHVFYERTKSCALIASAVAALRLAAGLETEVEPIEEAGEVDYGLVLAGPYKEGLGELALGALRRIRRVAVLHTPAYFAASEMRDFAEAARRKEVRYAAREVPEEIRYYRWVDGNMEAAGARRLSPYERRIVRMYEVQHL